MGISYINFVEKNEKNKNRCYIPEIPYVVLFQAVARIGANLCSLYNEAEEQRRFLSVITDAEWGIKLGKLEVMKYLNQVVQGTLV